MEYAPTEENEMVCFQFLGIPPKGERFTVVGVTNGNDV